MNHALSPWTKKEGPESEIVLSTRVRLARNFKDKTFPIIANQNQMLNVLDLMESHFRDEFKKSKDPIEFVKMNELSHIEKQVLVEKHLISPQLTKTNSSGVFISESEQVSIMVNEEDHIRIQVYLSGLNLSKALTEAFLYDDWIENQVDYAFNKKQGYLTTCPTNVGTGMRASVMIHLPALSITKALKRMIPAINQLGFVVRGIYGEGSEALGNIYQISNQITLGQSEENITEELKRIVQKLIEQEKRARHRLLHKNKIEMENQVFRSYGILKNARIIESHEAASRISNLRLGIDLGIIDHIHANILNELMVLIQPGFLQYYAKKKLHDRERDILRAQLIRNRLVNMEGE